MFDAGQHISVAGLQEEALIKGFHERDPKAVHAIYDQFFVKLCDFSFYITGDSLESQDIVSSLFERLLTKNNVFGKSFRNMADLSAYLHVSVRNKSFTFLEKSKRKKHIYQSLALQQGEEYSFNDELDFEYYRGLADVSLLDTLYNLPQRSIKVLLKIYFEEKSYEEIAEEMGITCSTVGNLRRQGLDILSKIFKKEQLVAQMVMLIILLTLRF